MFVRKQPNTTKSIDFSQIQTELVWFTRHSSLSNNFIVNLYLIWVEIIASGPDIIVTVSTVVHATTSVRIPIATCIVCNMNIMPIAKGWTIVVVVVCGAFITVAYVVFKVSISIIVSQ